MKYSREEIQHMHQSAMHDKIEDVLSKRSFSNDELDLILGVIKRSDKLVSILVFIKSIG